MPSTSLADLWGSETALDWSMCVMVGGVKVYEQEEEEEATTFVCLL